VVCTVLSPGVLCEHREGAVRVLCCIPRPKEGTTYGARLLVKPGPVGTYTLWLTTNMAEITLM